MEHAEGNGNLIGVPVGSTQDMDFAIVKFNPSSNETHPDNFISLAGGEPIRHGRSPLISSKPLISLRSYAVERGSVGNKGLTNDRAARKLLILGSTA